MNLFKNEFCNDYLTRVQMPGGVYTYLVEGKNAAAVIDTGCGYGSFRSYIEQLTNKPYVVVLTHGHVDHAGGAGEFENVYLNPLDVGVAAIHTRKNVRKDYLLEDAGRNGENFQFDEKLLVTPLPMDHYRPLQNGEIFDLGGVLITALPLRGHTPGDMCILIQITETGKGILLAGDAINSLTLLSVPAGEGEPLITLSEYRDNVAFFREHYGALFDQVIYSHPHNRGGKQIFGEMEALCEEILDGRDDKISMPGQKGFLAKKTGNDLLRIDGHFANLVYLPEQVR